MPGTRKRKPKERLFERTISFGVSEPMSDRIYAFLDKTPEIENTAAVCRYLIRLGLEVVEKEAANG